MTTWFQLTQGGSVETVTLECSREDVALQVADILERVFVWPVKIRLREVFFGKCIQMSIAETSAEVGYTDIHSYPPVVVPSGSWAGIADKWKLSRHAVEDYSTVQMEEPQTHKLLLGARKVWPDPEGTWASRFKWEAFDSWTQSPPSPPKITRKGRVLKREAKARSDGRAFFTGPRKASEDDITQMLADNASGRDTFPSQYWGMARVSRGLRGRWDATTPAEENGCEVQFRVSRCNYPIGQLKEALGPSSACVTMTDILDRQGGSTEERKAGRLEPENFAKQTLRELIGNDLPPPIKSQALCPHGHNRYRVHSGPAKIAMDALAQLLIGVAKANAEADTQDSAGGTDGSEFVSQSRRKCGKCGQPGHYAPKCGRTDL
ncbi:hypothetical protein B0H14DRAFT_3158655 [Mycena olivaceomarginata]|nr:hypothetical protein B0H14DRAFT_3158655 [Mycena olivaceomarginata]